MTPSGIVVRVLESHQAELLSRWKEQVQRHLAPGPLSPVELVDHMPLFLSELLQQLRQAETAKGRSAPITAQTLEVAREHGKERYRLGFSLGAVVREYGLMQELLLELLSREREAVSIDEWTVVSRHIHQSITQAVMQYAKERDEAARGSEAQLQAIIDNAPAAVIAKDAQGRYVLLNRGFEEMMAVSRQEALGKTDFVFFPHEVATAFRADDERVRSSGTPLKVEEWVPRADGLRTYLTMKFRLPNIQGGEPWVCAITTDVTALRQAQAELHDVRTRLSTVLAHLPLIIWAFDAHGTVQLAEGQGLTALGWTPAELVGRSVFELYRDFPAVLDSVRRALEGEGAVAVHPVTTPSRRWLENHYIPQRDDMGRVVGVVGVSVEVTERQEAQELHQRLMAIAGHDIRTPLSAIQAGVSLLLARGELKPQEERTAKRIRASAERIGELVDTLLDFTRARQGQPLPLVRRHVCLHDIGGRVLDEVQAAYPSRTLRCDAQGDTCGRWDPDRLAQLVQNLLDNAVKHSPPNTLVTATYRGAPTTVSLSVHNEGPPIPPATRELLFEPFRSGEQEAAVAKQSLGLGLYIVRQIVEAHGGTIEVDSSTAGTTFTVLLPRQY